MLTWRLLRDHINGMPESKLDADVLVVDPDLENSAFRVKTVDICRDEDSDLMDVGDWHLA
jgi:hypothetical protein